MTRGSGLFASLVLVLLDLVSLMTINLSWASSRDTSWLAPGFGSGSSIFLVVIRYLLSSCSRAVCRVHCVSTGFVVILVRVGFFGLCCSFDSSNWESDVRRASSECCVFVSCRANNRNILCMGKLSVVELHRASNGWTMKLPGTMSRRSF